MGFKRGIIQDAGLSRNMRAGDGSTWAPDLVLVSADAADTMTVAKMAAGCIQYTGLTAGRALTIDTATNITAAFPEMDVGDFLHFVVSITTAFALTWTAAAGVTLAGRATVLANTTQHVLLKKTGANTYTLYPL
jgi:hypothetical protein